MPLTTHLSGTLSSQSPIIFQHPHILGMFQGGHIIQVEHNDDGWKETETVSG